MNVWATKAKSVSPLTDCNTPRAKSSRISALSEVRKVFQKKRWGNLRFPLTDTYHECPPWAVARRLPAQPIPLTTTTFPTHRRPSPYFPPDLSASADPPEAQTIKNMAETAMLRIRLFNTNAPPFQSIQSRPFCPFRPLSPFCPLPKNKPPLSKNSPQAMAPHRTSRESPTVLQNNKVVHPRLSPTPTSSRIGQPTPPFIQPGPPGPPGFP